MILLLYSYNTPTYTAGVLLLAVIAHEDKRFTAGARGVAPWPGAKVDTTGFKFNSQEAWVCDTPGVYTLYSYLQTAVVAFNQQ